MLRVNTVNILSHSGYTDLKNNLCKFSTWKFLVCHFDLLVTEEVGELLYEYLDQYLRRCRT